ncbi:hypothetical protein DM02DRAFT_733178, partial [Periconia macrospinosa]
MANTLTLLRLPFVIIQLVFDRLSRKDLITFRLVSRKCNHLSEPFIFRTLLLHDGNLSPECILLQLLSRLCSAEDSLKDIVKHIQIGTSKHKDNYPGKEVLVKVLDNVKRLEDFTWHMRFGVPEEVMSMLSTKHPTARLHISNKERNLSRGSYIPPDTKALSSSQLYSLQYTAYGESVKMFDQKYVYFSELSTIKNALLQAKNLKRLAFQVNDSAATKEDFWTAGPSNLGFQDGDQFPALEDLSLEYEQYKLTEEHCQQWIKAMDWTKLRRLDLGRGAPEHLLVALTGQVPRLKSLKFGFWVFGQTWGIRDLNKFEAFSNSVEGLEELDAQNFDAEDWKKASNRLLSKHGHSLKSLHVDCCAAVAPGYKERDARTLVELCPNLENLRVQVAMVRDTSMGWQESKWPEATTATFQALSKLRNLELIIRTDAYSHEFVVFSSGNKFPLEEASEQRAKQLWEQLITSRADSVIESVTVKFEAYYPLKTWAYTVHTRSHSQKKFEVTRDVSNIEKVWDVVTPAGTTWDPWA